MVEQFTILNDGLKAKLAEVESTDKAVSLGQRVLLTLSFASGGVYVSQERVKHEQLWQMVKTYRKPSLAN